MKDDSILDTINFTFERHLPHLTIAAIIMSLLLVNDLIIFHHESGVIWYLLAAGIFFIAVGSVLMFGATFAHEWFENTGMTHAGVYMVVLGGVILMNVAILVIIGGPPVSGMV